MWLVGVDILYYPFIETFALEEQAWQRYEELKTKYDYDHLSVYLCKVIEPVLEGD